MKTIALVDLPNVLIRYVSVMADKVEEDAIFRSVGNLINHFESFTKADKVVLCFDGKGPSWRKAILPTYKANRTFDTSSWQDRFIVELKFNPVRRFDIVLRFDGYEADDVIASIATSIPTTHSAFARAVILSSDSDLLCLMTDRVSVYRFGKKTKDDVFMPVTVDDVQAKYGVDPGQLNAWKAIVGETGDNIAGVPKYGPVKTTKLLKEYGSLAAICQAARNGNVPGWTSEVIDWVQTARRLVAPSADVPFELWRHVVEVSS